MHQPHAGFHNPEQRTLVERRAALKLGGGLAVAGAITFLTGLLWHGNLPDATTTLMLRHISERPHWHIMHLLSMIGAFLWVGAFAGVAHSLRPGVGRLLGRMAVLAVTLGAAVFVVHYAIDGYRLKHIADAWRGATDSDQAQQLLLLARATSGILGGTFRAYIIALYGVPFILLGLAIARSASYPAWFGWIAVITGSGAVLAGTTLFVEVNLIPFPMLFGAFVIPSNIWLAALGLKTWRRAKHETNDSQPERAA